MSKIERVAVVVALVAFSLFGCVATKTKSKTELSGQSEQMETNVSSAKTEVEAKEQVDYRELVAEWLSEQTDYQEQRFDSLGNLISQIKISWLGISNASLK